MLVYVRKGGVTLFKGGRHSKVKFSFYFILEKRGVRVNIYSAEYEKITSPQQSPRLWWFNINFIKQMSNSIVQDIIQFVQFFFLFDEFSISINTTLVNLIPKIQQPLIIEDFRPIGFVDRITLQDCFKGYC